MLGLSDQFRKEGDEGVFVEVTQSVFYGRGRRHGDRERERDLSVTENSLGAYEL